MGVRATFTTKRSWAPELFGVMKLAAAVLAPPSVTAGPLTCVHS